MIIEFFGLPGSGKTVNMKALLDHFGSDARQVLPERGVLKNGGLRLVFSAEFLTFLRLIVGLWLRKKRKVRYDLRTLYHFSLLYLACMKRRGDESVRYYLLDHGLVQSVSSLVWDEPGLYAKSSAVLRHFERYFAGSLRFVFTDYADSGELVRRIKTRAYDVRLKHFADEEAISVLQAQRQFFAQAAEELKKGFCLTQIDSAEPPAANTERLLRELDNQG